MEGLFKNYGMEFQKIKITEVRKESADAISIIFDPAQTPEPFFDFQPGQHITLKLDINGKAYRRSYSLSSALHERVLKITVKKVHKGIVSTYLLQHIKAGDELVISKPEGHFCISPNQERRNNYYFFAAGSGITPVYSMIRSLLENEAMSNIYLLYGNRKKEDIIFHQELLEMAKTYEGQLFVEYTLSGEGKGFLPFLKSAKSDWSGWTGRINKKMIDTFLQKYPASTKDAYYYLCGPGKMIEDVKKELLALGKDSKHVHAEYFTSPIEAATTKSSSVKFPEKVNIKVHLNNETKDLSIPGNKKILDSLLDAGLDAPYSCCSGACSTCMAKLVSGEVKMDLVLALEPEEIQAGYILTCQAKPTTSEIEIRF